MRFFLLRLVLGALLLTSASAGPTSIVVDARPFTTAEDAANAEARVNWTDADQADDIACTQSFGALELQRYLRQMTGRPDDFAIRGVTRELPAGDVIVVGLTEDDAIQQALNALQVTAAPLQELGPEAYWLKSATAGGRRITAVVARDRAGVLFGAYDLLQRLGARWFAPGDTGEDLVKIESLVDMDFREQPSFVSRGFLAWENRGDPDFLLWMVRNRLNYWTLEQQPRSLMHKLGLRKICGRHDAEEEFLGPHRPYPYNHRRFVGDEMRLPDPYAESAGFNGDADGDGRLSYFEAHPEWYPLVGGKRIPGVEGNKGTNFCTSNPDATAEFVGNYVRALVDGPFREADIVRFWTLDMGKWCECDSCRAEGTPTDRYLRLVHRFCQELDKVRVAGRLRRPLEVTFLAYGDVVEPPSRPVPEGFPARYCMATFFPIRRCYVHRLDDPACTARNEQYRRQLAGWSSDPNRYYRGQLAVGEYYNVRGYNSLPVCFMHTMAADIPYYHSAGARAFDYMHVTTSGWGSKSLTNYQMARQLWNVNTDCEALWSDYFGRRYGPAAGTMRQFYDALEQMLSNVTELKYTLAPRLNAGDEDLFPTAHFRYQSDVAAQSGGPALVEMVEHGKRARQLLEGARGMLLPAAVKKRIDEDARCFRYAELTVGYYDACVGAFLAARSGRRDAAMASYVEAQRIAELLRQDTWSTQASSSHANEENAFVATRAPLALERIKGLLERP